MHVAGYASIHSYTHIKGLFSVFRIGQDQPCLPLSLANERMFVDLRDRYPAMMKRGPLGITSSDSISRSGWGFRHAQRKYPLE